MEKRRVQASSLGTPGSQRASSQTSLEQRNGSSRPRPSCGSRPAGFWQWSSGCHQTPLITNLPSSPTSPHHQPPLITDLPPSPTSPHRQPLLIADLPSPPTSPHRQPLPIANLSSSQVESDRPAHDIEVFNATMEAIRFAVDRAAAYNVEFGAASGSDQTTRGRLRNTISNGLTRCLGRVYPCHPD
jgi:hypothetical protein